MGKTNTEETTVVLVANKDIDKYVYSALRTPKCIIKARGTNVKRAIDTALICERNYGMIIDDVTIYNSPLEMDDKVRYVSNIDITLHKEV